MLLHTKKRVPPHWVIADRNDDRVVWNPTSAVKPADDGMAEDDSAFQRRVIIDITDTFHVSAGCATGSNDVCHDLAVPACADEKGLDNHVKRAPYYDGPKGKKVVFVPLAMGFDLTEG